ncbi:MAG TPA: hypothetical protein PKC18_06735, partial [Lacipirellulaceae bacterium]|nr:hypothetical protein [Lacipirellulaceae bacterium]
MVSDFQSGADVSRVLQRAVENVRWQLGDHIAGLQSLDTQVNDLVARRGGALLDLARHYLPDIRLETVQRTFVEVRDDLMEVLVRKQKRERELRDQAAAVEREAEHLEVELARITDALNVKASERDQLEQLVSERLHGSDEFRRLSEQAIAAEAELERNEERVAEMKAQAERKLPAYEQSRLFKYLYDAGFGTPQYRAKGWTRRVDRWIARMIDFGAARRGYEFLVATPELMEQEVIRRRMSFNELMQQVETIEDRVSDEMGLTEGMRAGQVLGSARDRLVAEAARADDNLLRRQQELLSLTGAQNEFYEQAVARMKNFLSSLSPARLEAASRTTPEREDDAIVAEVQFLGSQLTEADERAAALASQRKTWEDRLGGLQTVIQRFRQYEYDSRKSLFASRVDVADLVSRYVSGQIGPDELWTALQSAQRFAQQWHERPNVAYGGGRIEGDVSQVLLHVLT